MNTTLLVSGALAALLGLAHSVLGERLLLGPLFRQGQLPKLLGSAQFARRTLRFAWHLTTVLMVGIGLAVMALAAASLEAQTQWLLRAFAVMFALCGLVSLLGSRARHFSWFVFLLIAAGLWIGAS